MRLGALAGAFPLVMGVTGGVSEGLLRERGPLKAVYSR